VASGILSAILFACGGASFYAAHRQDQHAKNIAKLPASTLAEAAATAPSRTAYKFPNVKVTSDVKQSATIEVREEWERNGRNWKRNTVEEVLSRVRNGKLILVDDQAPSVKVSVPTDLVNDDVFEVIDEKFESTIPKGNQVDVSLNVGVSSEGGMFSAFFGDDHKPRTLGFRRVEMLIPADRKMFVAGSLNKKAGAEGTLFLEPSPKDGYFVLSVGSESDFLDKGSAEKEALRKAGFVVVGIGGLFAATAVLLAYIDKNPKKKKY